MSDVFNDDTLRSEIVKVWGEHGAHVDLFDFMLKVIRTSGDRIAELEAKVQRLESRGITDMQARIAELEALVRKLDLDAYDILMDGTVWVKSVRGLRLTGAEWYLVLSCDEAAS